MLLQLIYYIFSIYNKIEINLIEILTPEINKLGIEFEIFGKNAIIVRKIPTWIKEKFAEEFISEIFSQLINGKNVSRPVLYDNIAKMLSCKESIKANMFILQEEVKQLLTDLDNCKKPYTCPHGRPTMVKYSKYELEKKFSGIKVKITHIADIDFFKGACIERHFRISVAVLEDSKLSAVCGICLYMDYL